ncbi:hypothetical protein KUTeg_008997 [Tegillarca granosa]|uniref:non-specific serine/threonine protein kinase n=1 Tax=Tegillarca granosa TaxID=220873 RepID=A0ABQ9FC66_TEGGR|nr:hypothetical protein KUTeg_008997 [Tegillarca granosa]
MLVKKSTKSEILTKKGNYSLLNLSLKSLKKFKHFLSKYRALRLKRRGSFTQRGMPINSERSSSPEFKVPAEPRTRENYNVKLSKSEVELEYLLGSGGFGSVYKGTYQKKDVAVKVMHKISKNPEAHLESFKAEQLVLGFKHPNIVRTIATTSIELFNDGAWIVMELAGRRTLQSLINDDSEILCEERRLRFSLQIASALKYSHDKSVIDNEKGLVSPTQRSALTGTFAYRAPELLRGEAPTKKADIFSFGITLWEMLARKTPYSGENQHVVIFGVVAYGQRPKHPEIECGPFEECYRDLYSQCWSANSSDRPDAKELVELLKIWKNFL